MWPFQIPRTNTGFQQGNAELPLRSRIYLGTSVDGTSCELESNLLKGGYLGYYIGDCYRSYRGTP